MNSQVAVLLDVVHPSSDEQESDHVAARQLNSWTISAVPLDPSIDATVRFVAANHSYEGSSLTKVTTSDDAPNTHIRHAPQVYR